MKINIEYLKIRNFKGVDIFTHEFKGQNCSISGQNGSGKTTIQDAVQWLITGKNSDLSANFSILKLNPDGSRIDHLDAEVEATFVYDSGKITLRKEYKQVWRKKRGTATEELNGHTTDHFIDGVPVSQREYTDTVNKLIDDTMFRILSDTRFFCGFSKPDFIRKILIDLTGEPSTYEIIQSNKGLSDLEKIMQERSLDDHKKIIKARRKAIEKEIGDGRHDGRIPILIKEKQDEITDVSQYDGKALQAEVDRLDEDIHAKISKIGELTSGAALHDLHADLTAKQNELAKIDADSRAETAKKNNAKKDEIQDIENIIYDLRSKQNRDIAALNAIEQSLIDNEAKRSDLRKQWGEYNSKTFAPSLVCFACGQDLPDDQIADQKDKFNAEKAEKLRQINDIGKKLFDEHAIMNQNKDKLQAEMEARVNLIDQQQKKVDELNEAIHKMNNENGVEYATKTHDLMLKIAEIQNKIDTHNETVAPEKEAIKTAISALEDEKDVVNAKLLEITHSKKAKKRISELKKEQKQLVSEYQKIEKELWMIEEFDRQRSKYIEQSVNKFFSAVTWKLFEEQQNGGIREICEPLINGVPYSSDLNAGARIVAGLDVINVLSKHFDLYCPVFVDDVNLLSKTNAQGISIPWPEHQHIKLIVSDEEGLIIV